MTSLARHVPERSPSRDPPVRRAAGRPQARRRRTTHRCHHTKLSSTGALLTRAGQAEPPLSRRARRRARCLARCTRSLCHLTGLRSPRPTTATVTPHRTTSVRTASTTPVREGTRRPAIRETVPERQWRAQRNGEGSHHDRISGHRGRVAHAIVARYSATSCSIHHRVGHVAVASGRSSCWWSATSTRSIALPTRWRGFRATNPSARTTCASGRSSSSPRSSKRRLPPGAPS